MVDVTVKGAGIFGLSIAWACLRRGALVRVVDPNGVAAGASGGIVGALAPHSPDNWNAKKAFQFDSLQMAERFWTEVEEVGGQRSGYGRVGRLQPVLDDRSLQNALQRAEDAKTNWQGIADWRVIKVADAGDWVLQSPTGYLIQDTLTGRIHPKQGCLALAAAIQAKGGEIVSDSQDEGAVVWATGWQGFDALNDARGRMVGNGVKGQAALLDLDRRGLPMLFADTIYVVPHADGTTAVGSTSERYFDDPTMTDHQLDEILAQARALMPELAQSKVIQRWAGVRPRSRSRAPMLGPHPYREGEFIANGAFKIGFGMAPKLSDIMADLILNQNDQVPESFRPEASL